MTGRSLTRPASPPRDHRTPRVGLRVALYSALYSALLVLGAGALMVGCTSNAGSGGQALATAQPLFGADALPSDATATDATATDVQTTADVVDVAGADIVVDSQPAGAGDGLVCTLGASRCGATGRELCGKSGWLPAKCDLIAPVCVAGSCLACTPNSDFCADVPLGAKYSKALMRCDATGASSKVVEACAAGPCVKGKCVNCTPGAYRCNAGAREVCAGGGLLWSPDHCPADTPTCVDGACKVCTPSGKHCGKAAAGADTVLQCDGVGGSAVVVETCVKPTFCSGGSCVSCKPGSGVCKEGALATCKPDGSDYDVVSCPASTPVCVNASCKVCEPNGVFCRAASDKSVAAVMACGPSGDTASAIKACDADEVCHKNACKSCVPSLSVCIGTTPLVCAIDGTSASAGQSCAELGLDCGESGCGCTPVGVGGGGSDPVYCAPPAVGLTTSSAVWTCDPSGTSGKKALQCPPQQVCLSGKCATCSAGEQRCDGNKAMVCAATGQGWQVAQDCDVNTQGATTCVAGVCVDVCTPQDGNKTNLGCRFWATDLDNAKITSGGSTFDAQNAPFGVALVNSGKQPAVVTITYGPGTLIPVAKTTKLTVAAGAAQSIVLPPPEWKLPPASLDGTSLQGLAFRVDSTSPIAAFQYNPLQANAFSADASMLLPANALGTSHRVLIRKQSIVGLRAYVAIVATRSGTTKVTLTTTAATLAGDAVPALAAGVAHEISVQQGQVLNVETAGVGDDLSGTLIEASKPVAVFAGSEAAYAPDTDTCVANATGSGKVCVGTDQPCAVAGDCAQTCCADHLEAQLPPLNLWGTSHIAAQLQARGSEPSVWRIVAGHNGTTVLIRPAVTPLRHLQAGQWFEVLAHKDLVIESNKPVLVGQFMASSGLTGKSLGDPAFIVVPPVTSLGRAARFWVPPTYTSNFVSVTSPSGATLKLDGKTQAAGTDIPHTGWAVWRLAVGAGFHALTSTEPVGAVLHGWSKDGSYGHSVGHGVH